MTQSNGRPQIGTLLASGRAQPDQTPPASDNDDQIYIVDEQISRIQVREHSRLRLECRAGQAKPRAEVSV